LVRTRENRLWHEADDGSIWRRLSWVGDRTVERLTDAKDARSAGELIARFHEAVSDLNWQFRCVRPGFHDTDKRIRRLEEVLGTWTSHRLYDPVAALSHGIFAAWANWRGPRDLPHRVVHGDLKISNVRFDGAQAVALIDLDTLAHGTLDAELGDAFRSWCNPASEDSLEPAFDVNLFEAAVDGYARGANSVTHAEFAAIVPGVERIALELAARFAADALEENYFGFNPRFGTRGDHNLLRASGQFALANAVRLARPAAEAALDRALRAKP
jgi:Ser/Thr protein kinase RdoA (MazF antagonist)